MLYKKIILFVVILALLFPLVDNFIGGFFDYGKLYGDYKKTNDIDFSAESYFNIEYQKQKTKYFNDNLKMYPFLIRVRNQYLFSFFNKTNTVHTIIGKDNYLFDITYIDAYYGNDYIGDTLIAKRVNHIIQMKNYLNYYNKKLVVCFLPGKASFYPEKIPNHLQQDVFNTTNIDAYTDRLLKNNIAVLNLKNYFINAKNTSKYSLYPKYGIHMSTYATVLAADTLIKFIEDTFNIDIPNILIEDVEYTNKSKYYDDDILISLNLLFPPKMDTLAYPYIFYSKSKDSCKALVIGDSFYKHIFDAGIHTKCFNHGSYWYYYRKVWPLSKTKEVKDLDIRKEVLKNDIVILFATEATLYGFPYGASYNINDNILPLDEDVIKKHFLDKISTSNQWKESIKKKAIKNNISYKQQKDNDVDWLTNKFINKLNKHDKDILKTVGKIKSDSVWYNAIKQKAITQNKSINYILKRDAEYHISKK